MAAQPVGKTHVQMREIAEIVEQRRPLAAHLDRRGAGDRQDHRQIVRRQIPQRVVLGVELAEPEPVRMDVPHLAELAIVDQRLQLLEGRVEAQHMADHEDAAIVACAAATERSASATVSAIGFSTSTSLPPSTARTAISAWNCGGSAMTMASMSSRTKQLVGRDGQAILLAGKAFGARTVGVRDRMQRAERLQGADVVAAPVSATEDCDARFHQLLGLRIIRGGDIAARPRELNPRRIAARFAQDAMRPIAAPRRRNAVRTAAAFAWLRDAGRQAFDPGMRTLLDRPALATLYPRDLGERLDTPFDFGRISGLSPPWRGSSVG